MWQEEEKGVSLQIPQQFTTPTMLYEFKLDHNVAESIKNICWMKVKGAVAHQTVEEISLGLYKPRRSGKVRPKTLYSKAALQAIKPKSD